MQSDHVDQGKEFEKPLKVLSKEHKIRVFETKLLLNLEDKTVRGDDLSPIIGNG